MLKGLKISSGTALANVIVLEKSALLVPEYTITDVEQEISRFNHAHTCALEENRILYEKACQTLSKEDAAIFLAHKEILEDEFSLVIPITDAIRNNHWNAAKATDFQFNQIISMFENMGDEYMKARALDARDIRERLLRHLLGIQNTDLNNLEENHIIAAYEITPSDTARMNLDKVAGFITETGGSASHSAIIARNLGIPAVSMIPDAVHVLRTGMQVLLDGTNGTVETEVTEETINRFLKAKQEETELHALYNTYKGKPTITKDGHQLSLFANIGVPKDVDKVLDADAEGIGLFRSEFLYMDSGTLPDEETQFEAYKAVLEKMNPKPVIIRTLDIGGDKELPSLNLSKEDNPFLGYRAIRICLDRTELFRTQLRALVKASSYGNLQIMFPMISSLEELRTAKAVLNEVKTSLSKEGFSYSAQIPVGMMIEVPGAAVMADDFAKEVDFFSIGTNDLTQYTLAADRGNPKVAHLYNPRHPAVLSLIRYTIEAAHKNGIPCGICGESAGDTKLQPLFIRYGIDELSMSPTSILKSRMEISKLIYTDYNTDSYFS